MPFKEKSVSDVFVDHKESDFLTASSRGQLLRTNHPLENTTPFKAVCPSVSALNLGVVNCFLLQGTFGYALIDTGVEKNEGKILATLAEAGLSPKQIKYILLTHAHADHAGSAAQLQHETSAKVIAY